MRRESHSSPREPDSDASAAQSAAEWVARRDRGLSAEQQERLAEWKDADPRNATELERMGAAWKSLDGVRGVSELEAMADMIVARSRRRQARERAGRLWALAFAAAAAVAVGIFTWRSIEPQPPVLLDTTSKNYRVLASTAQRMLLPDGSVAELNGTSRVEVDFTATERRVRLTEGEAHFVVAKNPERPFYVSAGPVTVRAVGTAFNVRLASEVVEVLVTEGKVKLENASIDSTAPAAAHPTAVPDGYASGAASRDEPDEAALVAGQRAVINRSAGAPATPVQIGQMGRSEIDEALGWQSTRLVFNNTPLSEVVEGFNRYNSHRLTIGDPEVRNRTLTGVFRADNVEGFVRLLRHSIDVKAELRTPTETVLLTAR